MSLLESPLSGQTERRFLKLTTYPAVLIYWLRTIAIKVLLHKLGTCYNNSNAKMSPTEKSVGFSYV